MEPEPHESREPHEPDGMSTSLGRFKVIANLSAVALGGVIVWYLIQSNTNQLNRFIDANFVQQAAERETNLAQQKADRDMFKEQMSSIRTDSNERIGNLYSSQARSEDVHKDILRELKEQNTLLRGHCDDTRNFLEWCKKNTKPNGGGNGQ